MCKTFELKSLTEMQRKIYTKLCQLIEDREPLSIYIAQEEVYLQGYDKGYLDAADLFQNQIDRLSEKILFLTNQILEAKLK